MSDLTEEIQGWLARTGLSYRRAAELLDVGHVTLHRWAHGQQPCQHPGMLRWAMRAIEERGNRDGLHG